MSSDAPKRSILFVCVANSCRSQMAEAIAKSLAGDQWEVQSAGSHPSGRVHPVAIAAMKELGLDLSGHRSKGLEELPAREWDYVVTMGCGDACPAVRARRAKRRCSQTTPKTSRRAASSFHVCAGFVNESPK